MTEIKRFDPIQHDWGSRSRGDVEECLDGDYVRWVDVKGIVDAKERLQAACELYVKWYGTGEPEMGGGAMAYEMVCFIRQALAALEGKKA